MRTKAFKLFSSPFIDDKRTLVVIYTKQINYAMNEKIFLIFPKGWRLISGIFALEKHSSSSSIRH